jgi:P-type E1-E2 ATPase
MLFCCRGLGAQTSHKSTQGLPATVTSLLSLTALRLRDRQVLIKRTDIIENLGAATVIASDKTGTLTQNRMTVEHVFCNMVGVVSECVCMVHASAHKSPLQPTHTLFLCPVGYSLPACVHG